MELFRFLGKKRLEKKAVKKSKKDALLESGLFEEYKSEDLREYLPSLAMGILKELCDISPYICENTEKKKENYRVILDYLKKMHDSKSYASPQALRRALGASTSTRLVEKIDDILSLEAAKMRNALPKDSLDSLKGNLESDKLDLRKKLLFFLNSKDLSMRALLDGVGYSEKELEKLIKNSSDIEDAELKRKAAEALKDLLYIKDKVLKQAELAYERFIKTGALPEERDFGFVRKKNVFYKLSFVEDRIISRIMAFASDRMSQHVKSSEKNKRKKAAPSQESLNIQEKAQKEKEVSERQDAEIFEDVKQILLDELQKENTERRYLPRNSWPSSKNTGPVYKDAIEAYFEYFKNKKNFDEKELAQVIKDYCIKLTENSNLKERTIKTIIKQVRRAYEKIFEDTLRSDTQYKQTDETGSTRESVKSRENSWIKGFMIGGTSALALVAVTFIGYKSYVSFSERVKVESSQHESNKSKDNVQILEKVQCKIRIKKIKSLLDSMQEKLLEQGRISESEIKSLKAEISQLQDSLRRNTKLVQILQKDLDELEKKLGVTFALLEERKSEKVLTPKIQMQADTHKEQAFELPSKLQDFLNNKLGIKRKLKERGFSDEKTKKVYLLFAKGISTLFKNERLNPLNYGFQSYKLDMPWPVYRDDFWRLLNYKFSNGVWVYDLLFSKSAANKFGMSLSGADLKVAKEVFKEAVN